MRPNKMQVEEKKMEKIPTSRFCFKIFEEFCNRTDLHGFKYIVMPGLTIYEKMCWAIAVALSMFCAGYFVVTAYWWYARNPIMTVIESTHGAIWDVPFPAVTICSVNQISRHEALRFSQSLKLPENVTSEEVFDALRLAPLLHSVFKTSQGQKNKLAVLQTVLDINNVQITDIFWKLSPARHCQVLVQRCMWKNTVYRCGLLFRPLMTQFGLCCTFNYYAIDSIDYSNITNKHSPPTPRRVASCGYQTALTVLLNNDLDDYYSTSIASYGALILIDNAYNLPELDTPTRLVSPSMEMFIALTPERTYATKGVSQFLPEQRKCYFTNEKRLNNLKYYSYHNCMSLRRIDIIKKHCQCTPFYAPTVDGTSQETPDFERTCNFTDMGCLENAQHPYTELQTTDPTDEYFECLPDCEHYDYPLEVALGMMATDAPLDGLLFFKDLTLTNQSLVNVFFNDLVSTRYRRDVYLNWQNLLASFGGLLSLMLGFTLISAIDFVIFFIFKMAYDAVMQPQRPAPAHQKQWTKSQQIFVQEQRKKAAWKPTGLSKRDILKY